MTDHENYILGVVLLKHRLRDQAWNLSFPQVTPLDRFQVPTAAFHEILELFTFELAIAHYVFSFQSKY